MKSLIRYTKKRLKRVKFFLKSFSESSDLETLHFIRLEIKKIKALLNLIHYNKRSFKRHSSYIPFRSIFRDCEKIREPQVLHNLIAKFTEGRAQAAPHSSGYIQEFTNTIPVHLKMIKKQGRGILKEIITIKTSTYNRYLKKKQKELRKASLTIKVRDLHPYRKLIKEIYYLLSITHKTKAIDSFFKEADNLIGDWHDKSIVLQTIRTKTPLQTTDLINILQAEKRNHISSLKKLIKYYFK